MVNTVPSLVWNWTLYAWLCTLVWLCARVFAYLCKNKRLYGMLRVFPSPPTLPLIGNVHTVFGNANGRVKKFLHIYDKYNKSPIVVWLSSFLPMLILTKLEDIQTVSSRCVDRDSMGLLKDSIGDGIVIARAEKWKKTRRLINPAFSTSMLQQYVLVFNQQVKILVRKLRTEADTGRIFDVWQYMANANVDIITENITGSKLKTQENLGNEFSDALVKCLKLESSRLLLPWLLSPSLFYLYRVCTGNRKLFETLHKLPKQVLQFKLREHNSKKTGSCAATPNHQADQLEPEAQVDVTATGTRVEAEPEAEPKTLIDILLRVHETDAAVFTQKQIHDEMLNIIVTGSESTAVMGSFAILMLAIHQDAQQKAYEEVRKVVGADGNRDLLMDDLAELTYLEQCIKETLRVFTLFPITLRKTSEDIKLADERVIPKNCQVAMALHAIHRDPHFYPNPKQWNADNFSPQNVAKRPKNSFIPFGLGPRACIGSKYAIMSLKTQMAGILYHYHLSTCVKFQHIVPCMDAVVRSKHGYPIQMSTRKPTSSASRSS
ncbi:cytochrome P450 4g1-like [Planococcus citri]|uniref:cytochrome P450 4g1-like n=1 Tax=Planococcus citri TaxID=170843 RepID=UPI0031F8E85E